MRYVRSLLTIVALVAASTAGTSSLTASVPPPMYTVRTGDTLGAIATRAGTTINALVRMNGLHDANHIRVGQVIKLPGATGAAGGPYAGLGTWVDVYGFSPRYQASGQRPPLAPSAVDRMASAGIRTLYLQAAAPSDAALVDGALLADFLARAHAHGMKVVAWYAPSFRSVSADLSRLKAAIAFRAKGQRFDGIAVDIEWTQSVPDNAARNRALLDLSRRLRQSTTVPLGAIVMPPVHLDIVNPGFWPNFPWRGLSSYYDVWLPMDYWTLRSRASGYHDAARYTTENIARLRAHLGNPRALVHMIGGVGQDASATDYRAFSRASTAARAIGTSVYDYRTASPRIWSMLAR